MATATEAEKQRLDQWLWFARLFKSRSQAAAFISESGIRVNQQLVKKPAQQIGPQDILTYVRFDKLRLIRIVACANRRGCANEAQRLFEELVTE